jgi:hypothetical protein
MAKPTTQGTAEASAKLRWEPMKLEAIGTVAALLEGSGGSVGDPGGTGTAMMMVGA